MAFRRPSFLMQLATVGVLVAVGSPQRHAWGATSGVQADITGRIFSSPADMHPSGIFAHAYYQYPNLPAVPLDPLDDPHRYRGEAQVNLLNSMRPIRLFATDYQGDFFTGVTASAQWIDTITVSGPGPWPDHLRVQINLHSRLSLPPTGGGGGGKAAIGVLLQDSSELIGDHGNWSESEFSPGGVGAATSYFGRVFDDEVIRQGGEGVYGYSEFGDYSSWHTFVDLPRIGGEDEPEGYFLNLHAYATAVAFRSSSVTADAYNSICIGGVTMPDGSAVPGGVSFASGYRIAIPEPGSVALVALALGSLAVFRHRTANLLSPATLLLPTTQAETTR